MKILLFSSLFLASTFAYSQHLIIDSIEQTILIKEQFYNSFGIRLSKPLADSTTYGFDFSATPSASFDYKYSILHDYNSLRYEKLALNRLDQTLNTILSDLEFINPPWVPGVPPNPCTNFNSPLYLQMHHPDFYREMWQIEYNRTFSTFSF